MRLARQLRRTVPALLAALVAVAALVSAAHAHAPAAASGAAIAAESASHHAGVAGADLDCALCAAATRLAHSATGAPAAALALAAQRCHAPRTGDVDPRRVVLSRSEARAPPRLG